MIRGICLIIVALLSFAMPAMAQDVVSPWNAEVLDVRAETELEMHVGLSTTTYTAVNDFVFYVVEIALTYTNTSDVPIHVEVASDDFWLANQAGQTASASGTAGRGGGCVDCVTTFPLDVAADDSVTLNLPLVFVVAGDDQFERFTLTYEDMEPMAVLLGDGSAASASTATPQPTATPAPRFQPTPEGTLELTVIETPFCDEELAQGNIDPDGSYLCIEGDSEDWASKGEQIVLQSPDDRLKAWCPFIDLGVCISSGPWTAAFEPPAGSRLGLGLYEDAQRLPFQEAGYPGMDVAKYGGCNQLEGRFDVRELDFDPATGDVTLFAVVFEQYCEGGTVGLRGMVRWEAQGD